MEKLLKNIKIVLLAKNEAKAIGKVIKELKEVGFKKIIVIDGNSTDSTREIVKKLKVPLILDDGKGKGTATRMALKSIKNNELIAIMDADHTYSANDLKKMILTIKKFDDDMIIGNRFYHINFKSISLIRFVGNIFLTKVFNLLWGSKFPDLCSGIRIFSPKILEKIKLESNGFDIEAEINAKIVYNKGKIKYIPITYRPRIGKSKLQMKHGILIFLRILKDFWNLKVLNKNYFQ